MGGLHQPTLQSAECCAKHLPQDILITPCQIR